MKHDPWKAIDLLRGHLATHDTPIIFLFGAGTSSSINIAPIPKAGSKRKYSPLIPAVERLTEITLQHVSKLGKKFEEAWGQLAEEAVSAGGRGDVEGVLSRARRKLDGMGDAESLIGLTRDEMKKLEVGICACICENVLVNEGDCPEHVPHDDFAMWLKLAQRKIPVEIFTINYDILIERSLERAHLPCYDGFVGSYEPFFYSEFLLDKHPILSDPWIRLWKLHGSINWKVHDKIRSRVVRGQPDKRGEMILPSHWKYDESRKQPYRAMLDRLSASLSQEAALLITCGYSFRDDHINEVILTRLERSPRTNVFSMQFEDIKDSDPVCRLATSRPNLSVYGPNAGLLRGEYGAWELTDPVDKKTAALMDIPFDSDASLDPDKDALTGRMRLGDFVFLCQWLRSMDRNAARTDE